MFGWNVEILDSDNHKVRHKNKEKVCNHGEIKIGAHVWVASFSHILKNSYIPDGSIVANNDDVNAILKEEYIQDLIKADLVVKE